ncbi:DUF262 domain-containing protein [Campylobacter sp. 2018MI13]|uniref:DUF262 domain-containing protein n=1 Tax=Campylobacter sp. 2018MI13 TaxID=2836737 RepID=UPI001BDAE78A|nr:DUF262 domain-containing protein [Campylobacter sp. 2018MI13]MBT0881937.1 DUF262 domain-containing protein [Campylobacter sp. 2018MI13]
MKQYKETTSQICSLGEILSNNEFNKIFIIPPYQRLYAWKDEQIKALLDDFRNYMNDNDKTHFIGNIVVANNEGNFELVDGQQRLSTIFFLCVYMCFKNNKMQEAKGDFEKAYKFAFVQKGKEEKCRIHMPIREDDENAIWDYDFEKTNANIKLAFDYFNEYFEDNELESFCNFIFTNVKFNLVILGDQVELNKYFVRMNNTGVQLDGTDILKARLLEKIHSDEKTQDEVTKYARIFDECSQMNYFSDFGFVNNSKDPNTTQPTIENIIKNKEKLQNYSNNDKDRAEFESIIDFPTFVLHVFKILSRQESTIFKTDIKISIKKDKFLENTWDCLEFNNNCGAIIAIKIIRALKNYRIIFDTFVIKRKADDEENEYKLWNRFRKYDDKNDDWHEVDITTELKLIQNYLRVARRGDNINYHHFLTHYLEFCKNKIIEEQKEITNENCLEILKNNADKLKDYLKNIDDFLAIKQFNMANDTLNNKPNLIDEINAINFGDTISIKDDLSNINEDKFSFLNYNNRGNYKVNLTYWFHRLEYYLLIGNYHTDQEFGANFKSSFESYKSGYYFRNINSVEHILAQHEENQNNNKLDDKSDIDLFGNLALISSSENSSLNNQGYEKKKIDFKNNKIKSLKLFDVFENQIYKDGDKSQWLSQQIKKHQEKMLGVLQNSFIC